jgi:RimJ/RimL family protein N-acetyltransferase
MTFNLTWQSYPAPDGPLAFAHIPWDSALYGFPFYDLKLGGADPARIEPYLADWLRQLPADKSCLVVASIKPDALSPARMLIRHGFYPIETLIELHASLARFHPVITSRFQKMIFRPAQAGDLPGMMAIARNTFATDRFHLDPNLPAKKSGERYARWIENSFANGDVLCALENKAGGRIIGVASARVESKTTYRILLAGLDKAYHNTGAGIFLFQAIVGEGKTRGCKLAVTQASINNINSLRSAEKIGLTAHNAVTKFHWFRRGSV